MPNERIVEIPWAFQQLPAEGVILDIGSCEATYHQDISTTRRHLHCLDPRNCRSDIPQGVTFYQQSLLGNTLPDHAYDAVLVLSTIEHIGLAHYDQKPIAMGDRFAIAEIARLLKPGCPLILTVPAGVSLTMSWSRQYSPDDLDRLLVGWCIQAEYRGYQAGEYNLIPREVVTQYSYRFGNAIDLSTGAGAVGLIVARRHTI